jgi:hypothetical protein
MKTKIDLLPPSVRKIKSRRKEIKIFVCAQIIIFFALGFFIFYLNALERRVLDSQDANEFSALAEELRVARESALIDGLIAQNLPAAFEKEWLNSILDTVPENASLARVDYNRGEITVSGVAEDLNAVEIHRQNMEKIFTYVRSGRINRADGVYLYEMRVSP